MSLLKDTLETIETIRVSSRPLPLSKIVEHVNALSSNLLVELNVSKNARANKVIPWLKIGNGKHYVLWYGFPHANEPFGGTTILALTDLLLKTEVGQELLSKYSWILVPCIDPQGALINQPWIDRYPEILQFFMYGHRGLPSDQVEWSFPFRSDAYRFEKVLPETQLLIDLLNEFSPSFVHSIHNSLFNGMFAYVSDYSAKMGRAFRTLIGKWLQTKSLGKKEVSSCKTYAPGIFSTYGMEDILKDESENVDLNKVSVGDSAMGFYKRNFDGVFLLSEVPVLYDPLFPIGNDYELHLTKDIYSQYWYEKFASVKETLVSLWGIVSKEEKNDRLGRSLSFVIEQLISSSKNDQRHESQSENLLMSDFRLSQYYNYRLLLTSYAGVKQFLHDKSEFSSLDELNLLEKKVQSLIREFFVSMAGLVFEKTSAIVKTQLSLGLSFQEIALGEKERSPHDL